jgi:hypothetical protein
MLVIDMLRRMVPLGMPPLQFLLSVNVEMGVVFKEDLKHDLKDFHAV